MIVYDGIQIMENNESIRTLEKQIERNKQLIKFRKKVSEKVKINEYRTARSMENADKFISD